MSLEPVCGGWYRGSVLLKGRDLGNGTEGSYINNILKKKLIKEKMRLLI